MNRWENVVDTYDKGIREWNATDNASRERLSQLVNRGLDHLCIPSRQLTLPDGFLSKDEVEYSKGSCEWSTEFHVNIPGGALSVPMNVRMIHKHGEYTLILNDRIVVFPAGDDPDITMSKAMERELIRFASDPMGRTRQ